MSEEQKENKEVEKEQPKKDEWTESMHQMMNIDTNDDNDVFYKEYLLERVYFSRKLDYYSNGTLMFFDEKRDKLFGDKLLVAIYAEGEAEGHSERLGMDIKKHFVRDEYTLVSKSSIRQIEISQNSCADPDCESCVEGEEPVVRLMIYTDAQPISLLFDTQADAICVLIILTHWREGHIDTWIEDPFYDEYNRFDWIEKEKKEKETKSKTKVKTKAKVKK